jgi:alkylation response protein AidB-like acyl-CoA dehydrogenase
MPDAGGSSDEGFRAEVRAWLAENFPPALAYRDPIPYVNDGRLAAADPDFVLWRQRMVETGWGAPTWPKAYGGAGLDAAAVPVIAEEMTRIGAFNPIKSYGSMMLAPTLLEFGSEAQKARHIPPIARGERRWCQGFSEPGAGSDLAGLQTKCVDAGDHWEVTGQKIWTSGADHADWCFALVRTDASRKQGGISFLLIDMKSPGIEVRPIMLISGVSHFCEVFFDGVKVPKENLVGEVNQGWTIAKRLMQHERDSLASGRGEGGDLAELARRYVGLDAEGRIADADLRARLIRNAMRAQAFTLTGARKAAEARAGVGADTVSALKNLGSDVAQGRAELAVEILGFRGLGWDGPGFEEAELEATRAWLHSRAFSIYGGSQEVQNNITAKQVLGLGAGR